MSQTRVTKSLHVFGHCFAPVSCNVCIASASQFRVSPCYGERAGVDFWAFIGYGFRAVAGSVAPIRRERLAFTPVKVSRSPVGVFCCRGSLATLAFMGRPRKPSACKLCGLAFSSARELTRRGYCRDCGQVVAESWDRALAAKDPDALYQLNLALIIAAQLTLRRIQKAALDNPNDSQAV